MRKCYSCDGRFEAWELSGGECKTCRGEYDCEFCSNVVDENDGDQCEKCGFGDTTNDSENFICFECVSKFSCCVCYQNCCPRCTNDEHKSPYKCCGHEVLCGNNLNGGDDKESFCASKHDTWILDCGHVTCNIYQEENEEGACLTCETNKAKSVAAPKDAAAS